MTTALASGTITGAVTATLNAGSSGTVVTITGRRTTAGTTTLGTVPASKKWYIVGFTANVCFGAQGALRLQANAQDMCYLEQGAAVAVTQSTNTSVVFPSTAMPSIAATQTIDLVTTGNNTCNATVWYIEVSV
jgi:hypothetical protein